MFLTCCNNIRRLSYKWFTNIDHEGCEKCLILVFLNLFSFILIPINWNHFIPPSYIFYSSTSYVWHALHTNTIKYTYNFLYISNRIYSTSLSGTPPPFTITNIPSSSPPTPLRQPPLHLALWQYFLKYQCLKYKIKKNPTTKKEFFTFRYKK